MKLSQVLVLFSCCWLLAVTAEIKKVRHTEGDPDLENYLREAIENFREQMPKGIPEINMPVLDPLNLQDMDIQVNENIATMNLKLKELTIQGLSNFSLGHLKADLEVFFLHVDLILPLIIAEGHYNLQGRLFKIFPLEGHGYLNINATGIRITGTGQLELTNETVQMSKLELDLKWEKLLLDLENFMGGGSFSEVMQRLIPGVGRDVFLNYKPLILNPLEKALKCKINEKLNQQIIKNILKDILPK